MIADMWSTYINHAHYARTLSVVKIQLRPADVAQMMVLLKQSRSIYGNPQNRDNFIDATGYSALAGMLQLTESNLAENNKEDDEDEGPDRK
jgi:hypothetical protein